ncbi:MAG TPA: hypothetical protein VFE57_13395 [Cyclobacteriaceae bacterium]|jgi:hypothetical protein|nr:hypothetical protein [Cyclobacteriaceae bacterium]
MAYSFLILTLLAIAHIICATAGIYDLLQISRRRRKIEWLLFLVFVPFISVFIYSATKRRGPGRPASPTKINV